MKLTVKISSINVALIILTLVPLSIIPHTVEVLAKYIIIACILLRYLSFDNIRNNKLIVTLIVAYSFVLTYSTYINTVNPRWTLSAFMIVMQYLAMFMLFYEVVQKRGREDLTKNVLIVLGILILLNDLLMPIVQFHTENPDELYFLGNKFSVSYLHCLFGTTAYVCQRGNLREKTFLIWFAYSFFISMTAKCTTGMIMAMTIMLLICFPNIMQRIVNVPLAFPAALCIENILIWGSSNIFKQPWLVKIMTEVFHKSANMTGRERLYDITLVSVAKKPLLGYGYLTDLYRDLFGYGNAQNGLFHIVTQAGIIGAVIYFFMVTYALINRKKDNYAYGLYMFVYAMLIGSAVEINLSSIFLIAVAMINAFQKIPTNSDITE